MLFLCKQITAAGNHISCTFSYTWLLTTSNNYIILCLYAYIHTQLVLMVTHAVTIAIYPAENFDEWL